MTDPTGGTLDRDALAAAVKDRRLQLGLNQEALAARGGPSGRTVRDIENARLDRFTPSTLSKLDRALDWPCGTAAKVLAGTATAECGVEDAATPAADVGPCACVVGSPAWIERELATERRINAIAEVFRGEVQRLLALVEAARRG